MKTLYCYTNWRIKSNNKLIKITLSLSHLKLTDKPPILLILQEIRQQHISRCSNKTLQGNSLKCNCHTSHWSGLSKWCSNRRIIPHFHPTIYIVKNVSIRIVLTSNTGLIRAMIVFIHFLDYFIISCMNTCFTRFIIFTFPICFVFTNSFWVIVAYIACPYLLRYSM